MRPFRKRARARILEVGKVKDGIASGWVMDGIEVAYGLVVKNGVSYLGGWSCEELDLIANGSKR